MFMIKLLLVTYILVPHCLSGTWPRGSLTLIDVDETLSEGASGAEVVDAAVDTLDTACIFPSDKLLLRRYARAVANDGWNNTGGGIWQISEGMLTSAKRLALYTHYGDAIMGHFDVDWQTVTLKEMNKPLYSALAFKLYLQTLPNCSLPRDNLRQGAFLAEEFPSANTTTENTFVANVVQEGYTCQSPLADIVVVLDGSASVGWENFDTMKTFVKNFTRVVPLGHSQTRLGVVQYSTEAQTEIPLNKFTDVSRMIAAVEKIEYLGGPENDTGDVIPALWQTASLFSQKNGARQNSSGVSRIAIVLTQSNSNDITGTTEAVTSLRDMGVATFAVGIGGGVSEEYLRIIGSGCRHVTHLRVYTELEGFVPEIQRLVCTQPAFLNVGHPLFGRLEAGQISYASYNVNVDFGFKIDLSTSTGVIKTYLSTRTRNPNMASHQWRCRGAMNDRGTCFISPEQLRNLTKNGEKTIRMYATFYTDAAEGSLFYTLVAGNNRPYGNFALILVTLLIVKMATSRL